jgi:hypothetical protein
MSLFEVNGPASKFWDGSVTFGSSSSSFLSCSLDRSGIDLERNAYGLLFKETEVVFCH